MIQSRLYSESFTIGSLIQSINNTPPYSNIIKVNFYLFNAKCFNVSSMLYLRGIQL